MRLLRLLAALSLLIAQPGAAGAQSLPTPAFSNVTVGGSKITGVGTASGTVAAGDDSRITGALQSSALVSSLAAQAAAARSALGLAAVAASGSASDLSSGTVPAGRMPAFTGDVTTAVGAISATIAANVVTNAKLAQMAALTLKGNLTGAAANAADVAPSAVLDAAFGSTQGSVLYRGASSWAALGPGTSGQVLQSGGAGANPAWATSSGGMSPAPLYFGDGSDGALTIGAGQTVTLTRDMFYSNLTISGTGVLNTAGFKVFVSGTLDLTNAGAGALTAAGLAGNAGGTGASGGAGAVGVGTQGAGTTGLLYAAPSGSQGGGANAAGSNTSAGYPNVQSFTYLGGVQGTGGVGGAGSNVGGSLGTSTATFTLAVIRNLTTMPLYGASLVYGGLNGEAGSGGGGASGAAAGGGGGGGGGGNVLVVFAATVARGASTAAGAISANGGNGGAGGAPQSGAGAGGSGGGGGGGAVFLGYGALTGAAVTNMITAAGGTGGTSPTGTGTAGGGKGGAGGVILTGNLSTGVLASVKGAVGTAASGRTGGAGGTCTASL